MRSNYELLETVKLAFPIIAGQMGQMLMAVVDTLMVGRLGVVPLAGAALANSLTVIAIVFGAGLLSSTGVLVSQAHGAGISAVKPVILRSSIWFSSLAGLCSALALTALQENLTIFGQPAGVIAQAKPFLLVISWSMLPALVFLSSKMFCEALSRPLVPMIMMYAGLVLNVFLNWMLIYGNLGAPRFGLVGAAYATLVGRTVTMTGTLWYCFYLCGRARKLTGGNHLLGRSLWDSATLKTLLRLGLPAGMQNLLGVSAFTFATLMMGWLGATALAAHQIVITCAATSFMFPLGVSQAVSVRVGQSVGAGCLPLVRTIAFGGFGLSAAAMSVSAMSFGIFGHELAAAFSGDSQVVQLTSLLFMVAAGFQVADGIQITAAGALRGLADVRIPMLLAAAAYWVVGIPLACFLTLTLNIGPIGIWIGLAAGLFLAALLLSTRFYLLSGGTQLSRSSLGHLSQP
ncbi:MAG: MATE family efflux transporter [Verrucomicrobia bacterium]|nr:MATE family efflux transporter [Verrucomicrobiota bacterium]MBV9671429.1 MATE family efflux transporter [Verrucomicrobiota bacterium]